MALHEKAVGVSGTLKKRASSRLGMTADARVSRQSPTDQAPEDRILTVTWCFRQTFTPACPPGITDENNTQLPRPYRAVPPPRAEVAEHEHVHPGSSL
jgi:hypothetical protein